VGVNGTGKTTTIAKIARLLQRHGKSCVIAASDTFRAGAIEQLEKHASRLGVRVIKHARGSDPAAVAYDAVEHARARGKDVVLIDTAGRMETNVNLMDEMRKIARVARPDLVVYVGDALTGNAALEQAVRFHEATPIDGVILTKMDADAKGGSVISICHAIGRPVPARELLCRDRQPRRSARGPSSFSWHPRDRRDRTFRGRAGRTPVRRR
jgi:fused signal recognition particle receptor